jgi:hypothetical protein
MTAPEPFDVIEPDIVVDLLAVIRAAPPGRRLQAAIAAKDQLPSDPDVLRGELAGLALAVVLFDDGSVDAGVAGFAELQRLNAWRRWWDLLPEEPDR